MIIVPDGDEDTTFPLSKMGRTLLLHRGTNHTFAVQWASDRANKRFAMWDIKHAIRCAQCNEIIYSPFGSLAPSDIVMGEDTVLCGECAFPEGMEAE